MLHTRTTHLLFYCLVLAAACIGCRKKPPVPMAGQLTVQPAATFLALADIDSAHLTSQQAGTTHVMRLQRQSNQFSISTEALKQVPGPLELRLYGNKRINGHFFVFARPVVLPAAGSSTIAGPTALTDANWWPRCYLRDFGVQLVAVVGIRPQDPFFGLYNLSDQWREIDLSRYYYRGLSDLGGGTWRCRNGACIAPGGYIENRDFFRPLGDAVGKAPYNHVEIAAVFGTGNYRDGWRSLQFNFDFP